MISCLVISAPVLFFVAVAFVVVCFSDMLILKSKEKIFPSLAICFLSLRIQDQIEPTGHNEPVFEPGHSAFKLSDSVQYTKGL